MKIAIADSCFLINWARFHQRNDILKVFNKIVIPEIILDELEDVEVRRMIAKWVIKDVIIIAPRLLSLNSLTMKIVSLSESIPFIPRVDPPEAYCMCLAMKRGYIILTDNKAVKRIKEIIEEFKQIIVMNSLDVLMSLYRKNKRLLVKKILRFMRETGIVFPKSRLRELGLEFNI